MGNYNPSKYSNPSIGFDHMLHRSNFTQEIWSRTKPRKKMAILKIVSIINSRI